MLGGNLMFGHQDDSQPGDSQATMATSQDNNTSYDQTAATDASEPAENDATAVTDNDQMDNTDQVKPAVNQNDPKEDDSIAAGKQVLMRSLEQPFRILLENAGLNPDEWLPQVKTAKAGSGIDVNNPKQVIDLKAAGIIDPTRVTREVLQNASSIAGIAMTVGALIDDIPEPKTEAGPGAPDMGGMGMM